jgi:hypothetical protein
MPANCAPGWYRSAGGRAQSLMDESPIHKDKYLWFRVLHKGEVVSGRDDKFRRPLPRDFQLRVGSVARFRRGLWAPRRHQRGKVIRLLEQVGKQQPQVAGVRRVG